MTYFSDPRAESPEALWEEALHAVDDHIVCDGVSLFELLPEGTVLELVATQTIERDLLKGLEMPIGKGIAGQVAENGEGLISNNVPAAIGFHGQPDQAIRFRTRSILCCPMRTGEGLVGVLELVNKADGSAFGDAELRSVQALADGVAANWCARPKDRDAFHELCGLVRKVTRVEGISIFTVDAESEKLILRFSVTARQTCLQGVKMNVGQGVAGWVARQVDEALVTDVYQDPRFFQMADALNMFSTSSIAAVPIVRGGRLLGVLETVNGRGSEPFTKNDLATLRGIGVELAQHWIGRSF